MKKQVFGMIAALFVFAVLLPVGVRAADTAYAILYDDGELVFQNGNATEPGRTVKKRYEVDLTTPYIPDPLFDTFIPWYNERDSIFVVSFSSTIQPVCTAYWFFGCYSLERVDNIRNLDTVNVTNMDYMFGDCHRLTELDISHFDTSNVTSMVGMFQSCGKLTELDLSNFNTEKVKNMGWLFNSCSGLTMLDVSHFNTANVNYMFGMFLGRSLLRGIFKRKI